MKTAQEIAQSLGVDEATLRRWRAQAGIGAKSRNQGYTDEEVTRIEAIAAQKRRTKPRKEAMREELAVMRAESHKKAPSMRVTLDGSTAQSTPSDFDYTRIEGMYTAQLERMESKIDALTALLERAVIAPRYIARQAVEDALDGKPKRQAHYTPRNNRPKRGNGDVPRLSEFAKAHGVKERTANDHARWRLIEVKNVPIGDGKEEHYVLPEQEAGIIAYWKSISYPFTPCDLCPHTQEVQE